MTTLLSSNISATDFTNVTHFYLCFMPYLMGHGIVMDGLVLGVVVDGLRLCHPVVLMRALLLLGRATAITTGGALALRFRRAAAVRRRACLAATGRVLLGSGRVAAAIALAA